MPDLLVRLRALLDASFPVAIVVLLGVVFVAGFGSYTAYVDPGTTTEQRPGSSWEMSGQFSHGATVVKSNPIFPVNRTVSNRSIYFTDVTPVLDGTYRLGYEASERGRLNESVSVSLIVREVERRTEKNTIVWRLKRPLNATTATADSGETVRVPFSVNVSAVAEKAATVRESLGGSPGEIEVLVSTTVDYEGSVNGRSVEGTKRHRLAVSPGANTYRIDDPGRWTDRHESIRRVTVQRTYGPLRRVVAPAVTFFSLVALAGFGYARHRGAIALSDDERERLAYEDDRSDFDEWISTIELPDEAFHLPEARAASLGALVDFAIDTDNSVIEDPDGERYHVVHDGYLYTYEPPTLDPVKADAPTKTAEDSDTPDEGDPLEPGPQGTDD